MNALRAGTAVLFLAVTTLLYLTIAMSGRNEFGAPFLWSAWGLVLLGVATMALLFRR